MLKYVSALKNPDEYRVKAGAGACFDNAREIEVTESVGRLGFNFATWIATYAWIFAIAFLATYLTGVSWDAALLAGAFGSILLSLALRRGSQATSFGKPRR
jgi:TRAP-type C4-dicarboxylate transport system permease small subunit